MKLLAFFFSRRLSLNSILLLLAAIVSFLFSSNPGTLPTRSGGTIQAQTLTGKVVRVADGDTVTIQTPGNQELRIRFQGIDAPERSQAFGRKSGAYLHSLIYGKTIRVEAEKTDQHGRTVGRVWLDDPQTGGSQDVEEAMLLAGLAWHYAYFNHEKKLADAQRQAQAAKRGLWSQPDPLPPWKWRRQQKK